MAQVLAIFDDVLPVQRAGRRATSRKSPSPGRPGEARGRAGRQAPRPPRASGNRTGPRPAPRRTLAGIVGEGRSSIGRTSASLPRASRADRRPRTDPRDGVCSASRSPRNETLAPMTGPRSSRTGAGCCESSSSTRASDLRGMHRAVGVGRIRRAGLTGAALQRPTDAGPQATARAAVVAVRHGGVPFRLGADARGGRRWRRTRPAARGSRPRPPPGTGPLRCMSMLPLKCDAFGDGDARRDDVAVDRSVLADVDLLAGADVPDEFAQHDDGLREHLRLDPAVGPMVSVWSRSSILPSTCPSIVRSSLPSSSPLMTTERPIRRRCRVLRRALGTRHDI